MSCPTVKHPKSEIMRTRKLGLLSNSIAFKNFYSVHLLFILISRLVRISDLAITYNRFLCLVLFCQESNALLTSASSKTELTRIARREKCEASFVGEITGNGKV